jgi:hypothetical protein
MRSPWDDLPFFVRHSLDVALLWVLGLALGLTLLVQAIRQAWRLVKHGAGLTLAWNKSKTD